MDRNRISKQWKHHSSILECTLTCIRLFGCRYGNYMNIDYSILHDLYLAGVKSKQVEEFGSKEPSGILTRYCMSFRIHLEAFKLIDTQA